MPSGLRSRAFNSSWIGENSMSPEYHYGSQRSQLFDGPYYGSKRLVIYELRLSETRPIC
jgi:hypothetical protein